MEKEFIVLPKAANKKPNRYTVIGLRICQELQGEYSKLSAQSGHSRNQLMCRALRYALEHLKWEDPKRTEITQKE